MAKKKVKVITVYDLLPDHLRRKRSTVFFLPTVEQVQRDEEAWWVRWEQFIGIQDDDPPRIDAIKRLTLATWVACNAIENVLDIIGEHEVAGDPDPLIPASEITKYLVKGFTKARNALAGHWDYLKIDFERAVQEITVHAAPDKITNQNLTYAEVKEQLAGMDDDALRMFKDAVIQEIKERREQHSR